MADEEQSDLDILAQVFDLPPVEQVKRQIVEVRRRAKDTTAATATAMYSTQEERLWRELRALQAAEGDRGGTGTGLEDLSVEDVAELVEAALRDLPSHLVDRIGAVVDELRQVKPTRLKVIPGGR